MSVRLFGRFFGGERQNATSYSVLRYAWRNFQSNQPVQVRTRSYNVLLQQCHPFHSSCTACGRKFNHRESSNYEKENTQRQNIDIDQQILRKDEISDFDNDDERSINEHVHNSIRHGQTLKQSPRFDDDSFMDKHDRDRCMEDGERYTEDPYGYDAYTDDRAMVPPHQQHIGNIDETLEDYPENDDEHHLESVKGGEVDGWRHQEKVVLPQTVSFMDIFEENATLQQLVGLGIDLSLMQKAGLADYALSLDVQKDILPYFLFLRDCGIPPDQVAATVNKWPKLLQESVHNLQVRVDYLQSKKFKQSKIRAMILKDPEFLGQTMAEIDTALGFYQVQFGLNGYQMRNVGDFLAVMITIRKDVVKLNYNHMLKIQGFNDEQLRNMFIKCPEVFSRRDDRLKKIFDYVHDMMEISHDQLTRQPEILTGNIYQIKNRHRFLVRCGRAQFNEREPNYVPLKSFIEGEDNVWSLEVAKSSIAIYNQFLRMI